MFSWNGQLGDVLEGLSSAIFKKSINKPQMQKNFASGGRLKICYNKVVIRKEKSAL